MFQIFGTYRKGASTNILCRIFRLYNEYVSSWILSNSGMNAIKNLINNRHVKPNFIDFIGMESERNITFVNLHIITHIVHLQHFYILLYR